MRARVTSPNGGRREGPSEWLEAHLEIQPGREPGTPPPVPAPPPGPLSANLPPAPPRALGWRGLGRSPRVTVDPPSLRELPRGARTGAETGPGTRVGGRASARRTRAGGAHQFLVAPVVLVALPIQPLRQQLERDTRGVRVTTTAGRPGGTGTRGRGTRDAGADDRPGTAPAPAPAPAAETHGQTRAAAATAPVCPPALRSVRPPAVLTCAARRHGPAER